MGIDTSGVAVRMTARRGAPVRLQSVFDTVPDEGSWRHVLLADGNLGIGGDPLVLLRRVWHLLAPGGSTIVETDPPGTGLRTGRARIGAGPWFPWSLVAADAVAPLAAREGLALRWSASRQGRWFSEFARP